MTALAHVGGVPVEQLLPGLVAGAGVAGGRVWFALRRRVRALRRG